MITSSVLKGIYELNGDSNGNLDVVINTASDTASNTAAGLNGYYFADGYRTSNFEHSSGWDIIKWREERTITTSDTCSIISTVTPNVEVKPCKRNFKNINIR